MKTLFENLLKKLKDIINTYQNTEVFYDDAIIFEMALITLCLFCIGGQRREYIVGMHLKVSKNLNLFLFLYILN